ncbi:helix-turn-helix transcriptional regulator [Candidatus Saccharibacteria bacterium oral taxon 488]|nr:helix-turn-helix transcriptional regulator [Candidatus Saccharibacteria bacterium oral taxon 488]
MLRHITKGEIVHSIGNVIAQRRKQRNLTQQALAERLGVSDKAVSKWERHLSFPDITLLPQLASELGVSVDTLLDGKAAEQLAEDTETVQKLSRLTDYSQKVSRSRASWIVFIVFSVLCFLAVAATLIVNVSLIYATSRSNLWWPYVATPVAAVWAPYAIIMSRFAYRWWVAGGVFTILLTCCMFVIEFLTGTRASGWIGGIYFPALAATLMFPVLNVVLRRNHTNGWFVAAANLSLAAIVMVFLNWVIDVFISASDGAAQLASRGMNQFVQVIIAASLVAVAISCVIIGLGTHQKRLK